MAVIEELIRKEEDGTISFGNHLLQEKAKRGDFEFDGDIYKVKTFYEITKLERNGLFVYESVPGTSVSHMKMDEKSIQFMVNGVESSQITLELEPEKEYKVFVDDTNVGKMKTNLGGKLVISLDFVEDREVMVRVVRL